MVDATVVPFPHAAAKRRWLTVDQSQRLTTNSVEVNRDESCGCYLPCRKQALAVSFCNQSQFSVTFYNTN